MNIYSAATWCSGSLPFIQTSFAFQWSTLERSSRLYQPTSIRLRLASSSVVTFSRRATNLSCEVWDVAVHMGSTNWWSTAMDGSLHHGKRNLVSTEYQVNLVFSFVPTHTKILVIPAFFKFEGHSQVVFRQPLLVQPIGHGQLTTSPLLAQSPKFCFQSILSLVILRFLTEITIQQKNKSHMRIWL